MTHKQRILADRVIAVPVACVFNGLARLFGSLLRRDHSIKPENVKVIVVAKLIGMGSILQATPLLKALKTRYPEAKLIFVTLRSNQELLKRLSCVDEIVTIADGGMLRTGLSMLRAIAVLIRQRADLYFDLEVYSAFASLLALWAVTRNRLGFYRHSAAFKKGIYTHLVYFNTRMPVRRLYLQLGRAAGIEADQSEIIGPIRIEETERVAVGRILAQSNLWNKKESYIVVNPNASDLLLERRWPVDKIVEAINRLADLGNQIVLMGARNETPFVQSLFERLAASTQERVVNTAGRLSLGELLALLEGAACILTNDTGPMHMAIALRRPTVCLFGPANPEHYGQELPYVEIFYGRVFCSPCLYEADTPPCAGNNICMQRIEPKAVVEAVQRLTTAAYGDPTSQLAHLNYLPLVSDSPDGRPMGVLERAISD